MDGPIVIQGKSKCIVCDKTICWETDLTNQTIKSERVQAKAHVFSKCNTTYAFELRVQCPHCGTRNLFSYAYNMSTKELVQRPKMYN